MAQRPVFLTSLDDPVVMEKLIPFEWFPGFHISQKQRSIDSLHENARDQLNISRILEVSTKSPEPLGQSLSAFNLKVDVPGHDSIPLESAFHGSKVFAKSDQLSLAYELSPRDAKRLAQERNAAKGLIGFKFGDREFGLEPKSWFYDWLYLQALALLDPAQLNELAKYEAFTDIEFNPKKSFSCQARTCAIAVALMRRGDLAQAIDDPDYLRRVAYPGFAESAIEPQDDTRTSEANQLELFGTTLVPGKDTSRK